MESRWYLFPGQTMENSKISDRVHALHITKAGWDGITKHLDRKKLMQEAVEKELAIKKYLDDGSKNMTKGWENSLENVRKRKEDERLRLLEEKKEERQRKFLELRKEQEEIRAKYMEKVQKQIFMGTGYAKDLTSALVLSEVLHERQKQQELLEKIKNHEKEENLAYVQLMNEKDEKALKAEEEKKKKLMEKEKKYGEELKKTVEERALLERQAMEAKIRKEAMDNLEAVKEMAKMEKMQTDERLRRKKELAEEKKAYLQKLKDTELQKAKEEKELDEVIQIYRDTKHRIDCMKQDRVQELRDAAIQRRQKIASMVMAEQMDRSEAEDRAIKKAMAEKEAAELEKLKAKQEFNERMKQERLRNREEMLAKEAERKKKQAELEKWELLNRYKSDENVKKYEEMKKREHWQAILKNRADLCEQMEDRRLEEERNKEIEEAMDTACLQEGHERFFQYANEVLELAKKKGRNTFPIEKVINRYIKDMNITTYDDPRKERKKLVPPPKAKLCRLKADDCQRPKRTGHLKKKK